MVGVSIPFIFASLMLLNLSFSSVLICFYSYFLVAGDFDGCGRFPGFFGGPNAAFNLGDSFGGGYTFHFG